MISPFTHILKGHQFRLVKHAQMIDLSLLFNGFIQFLYFLKQFIDSFVNISLLHNFIVLRLDLLQFILHKFLLLQLIDELNFEAPFLCSSIDLIIYSNNLPLSDDIFPL